MPKGRNNRMQQWINYRVRVTIQDSRMLVGTFMAFDKHMNVVLADCDEFRMVKKKGEEEPREVKRPMGFVVLRGENIIAMTAEAPPPQECRMPGEGPMAGPGKAHMMGRGVPVAPLGAIPTGLGGPIRGIGGPGPGHMLPGQMMRPPQMPQMARPPPF